MANNHLWLINSCSDAWHTEVYVVVARTHKAAKRYARSYSGASARIEAISIPGTTPEPAGTLYRFIRL